MQAVIYSGEGVDALLLRQIVSQMPIRPKRVDRHFFLSNDWEEGIDLIIIPGGRDVPYHEHLQGEPNKRIRKFVEEGGSFLGICAGGYYGSKEVVFEEGGELEVIGERELAFFPGRAVGPAYGNGEFSYLSQSGARIAKVKWEEGMSDTYFNGGCYFEDAHHHAEVLATYEDLKLPAIVSCAVGKGRAILSGVHLECSMEDDGPRKKLWDRVLTLLDCSKSTPVVGHCTK